MTIPFPELNRNALTLHPLAARENRANIERDHVAPDAQPAQLTNAARAIVEFTADRIRHARDANAARMLAFGAHTIKNGLGPVLIQLIEDGWITHLATNGAGIIHDWEFAYLGETSEHVQQNVADGTFGAWDETGLYINLALAAGAYENRGYGESIGALIQREGLDIPRESDLRAAPTAAALDFADVLSRTGGMLPGFLNVPHPYKEHSVQAAAFRLGIPFTGHPMIGHDIIYLHPASSGAAIGRTAERDFLRFAHGVSQLSNGVYLSVGSAVMSPMIFEKSMSMAQNLALQHGTSIQNHTIVVVDLAESNWDWTQGEPPETNPDYYLRYNKTFARMGGTLRYASADNRDFLLALIQELSHSQS
jgi:hypothetical protein